MFSAVFLTVIVSNDGDTNWFEGAMLLGAYVIIGIGFYLF
jgi:Ca2+:H+ antiporter